MNPKLIAKPLKSCLKKSKSTTFGCGEGSKSRDNGVSNPKTAESRDVNPRAAQGGESPIRFVKLNPDYELHQGVTFGKEQVIEFELEAENPRAGMCEIEKESENPNSKIRVNVAESIQASLDGEEFTKSEFVEAISKPLFSSWGDESENTMPSPKNDEFRNAEREPRCDAPTMGCEAPSGQFANTNFGSSKAEVNEGNSSATGKEGQNTPKSSFASVLQGKSSKYVKITEMRNDEQVDGATVVLPLELVREMNQKFENTLYGYFIGKRLAYPVVEHYVKNVWSKFGLERVMLKDGFFLFKFDSRDGLNKVLESGPWLIRLIPLILNVWTPNTILKKETLTRIPVWVKIHNIPLVAFSEKGSSLIATQIGRPIMMDSFTSDRCLNPWGKGKYARILIQISSEIDLPESVVIAIPALNGKRHGLEKVTVGGSLQDVVNANCLITRMKIV